jgi:hypothetical protein
MRCASVGRLSAVKYRSTPNRDPCRYPSAAWEVSQTAADTCVTAGRARVFDVFLFNLGLPEGLLRPKPNSATVAQLGMFSLAVGGSQESMHSTGWSVICPREVSETALTCACYHFLLVDVCERERHNVQAAALPPICYHRVRDRPSRHVQQAQMPRLPS